MENHTQMNATIRPKTMNDAISTNSENEKLGVSHCIIKIMCQIIVCDVETFHRHHSDAGIRTYLQCTQFGSDIQWQCTQIGLNVQKQIAKKLIVYA